MTTNILTKYKIKAKKALGQNFLINESILEDIACIVNLSGEGIIEVGPGYGALTEKLLEKKPKSLTLIELDRDMIDILEDRINSGELVTEDIDFKIENKDILKYKPELDNYSVIANIPYYITSPILRYFLYNVENKPKDMLILMQKEVGEKILGYGKDKSSVLSLLVSKKSIPTKIIDVAKEDFVPVPKIDSSVILFEYSDKYSDLDDDLFLKVIKQGFRAVRKKLVKNFTNAGYEKSFILKSFEKLGINENIRGEDLDIDTWVELVQIIG